MICPECGSENIGELPDGSYKCLDCGHRFEIDEGEEAEEEQNEQDREWEEDSSEDSEGDGMMGEGDMFFPPENFDED